MDQRIQAEKDFFNEAQICVATEAAGEGIAKGINKGGGIKVSSSSTEKIMIKCRECGYLESIDAEFCSKCGKKM